MHSGAFYKDFFLLDPPPHSFQSPFASCWQMIHSHSSRQLSLLLRWINKHLVYFSDTCRILICAWSFTKKWLKSLFCVIKIALTCMKNTCYISHGAFTMGAKVYNEQETLLTTRNQGHLLGHFIHANRQAQI